MVVTLKCNHLDDHYKFVKYQCQLLQINECNYIGIILLAVTCEFACENLSHSKMIKLRNNVNNNIVCISL